MLWKHCCSGIFIDSRTLPPQYVWTGAVRFQEVSMTFDELKDKALTLPYVPGVYIMRDKNDCVIYVGKAKKLKKDSDAGKN